MRTTAIFNCKGGVGKTVSTINLAAELARAGRRVVCVDADPQCNLTEFFAAGGDDLPTLYDVLTMGVPSYLPSLLHHTQIEGVDVLPASSELILADVRAINDGSVKLDALRALAVALAEEDDAPDHMLIDCPPSFTAATTAALAAADDVIIPIKLDRFSLDGVRELLRQINGMREINPRLTIAGILVTQYDGTTVAKETADAMRESALPVFGTCIRRTTAVDRSTFERQPLRRCKGTYANLAAEEYADVVKELLEGGAKNGF